jgi:isoleucyl-tRNA synthetase
VHAVQGARKAAGLEVEDRIQLGLGGDAALMSAVRAYHDYVAGETLAVELSVADGTSEAGSGHDYSQALALDGLALTIGLSRAKG